MRKFKLLLAAGAVVAASTLAGIAFAADTASTAAPACNQADYAKSIDVSAKPTWKWVKMGGIGVKVVTSTKWKVGTKKLAAFDKATDSTTKSSTYYFGRALDSAVSECAFDREYTVQVQRGDVYNPSLTAYQARVERIGNNVATIYSTVGDTDCPGETAVIFKGKNIVTFSKLCSNLDAESRTVIASIY